jgi:hypothetical protein
MKKLTNEYRFDIRLRWQPWLKARLAVFASFTRQIVNLKSCTRNAGKSNGSSVLNPGSAEPRVVQQDTDLGS